ncbi:DUF4350 domain-containing protein [Tsuneonella sp. HG249]
MSGVFNPRTVLAVIVFGAVAFLAMLWFIGQGDTGPGPENGQAHAAGHGLTGYAGLADLLQKQGHSVSLSRTPARFGDEALLILTPTMSADPDDIIEVIEGRRYQGPTLLILPKWFAAPLPPGTKDGRGGWVSLISAQTPPWAGELDDALEMDVSIETLAESTIPDWRGTGELAGRLPDRSRVQALRDGLWAGVVRDSSGRDLVAYTDDDGCYPVLDTAAGYDTPDEQDCDGRRWTVMVVFEPDILNNYGLAERNRAMLAARLVDIAREGQDIPVIFDLTLAGLGGQRNLLTLAFAPPFLAATLCLIAALVAVGWRAFGRFGPPFAEVPEIAFGKTQLASNSAGLVRRSRRYHLLARPYAGLVGRRLAAVLGLRGSDASAIDAALARRPDELSYSALVARLEQSRGANETLRAAHALYTLERTLRR